MTSSTAVVTRAGPQAPAAGPARRRLFRAVRVLLSVLVLVGLLVNVGADPFRRSLQVLTPAAVLAALLLGAVTTASQAMRWRVVAFGLARDRVPVTRAVREYYRSTFLNCVLPAGVAGDALRAWRQSARPDAGSQAEVSRQAGLRSAWRPGGSLRRSVAAVVVERCIGTLLLLLTGAALLVGPHPVAAALLAGTAVLPAAFALPGLLRLSPSSRLQVVGWSVLAMAALVGLFVVTAGTLGTVARPSDAALLGLATLAGASIPLGVGGYGPREVVAATAFALTSSTSQAGVATAAAFGLLTLLAALPGAVVIGLDLRASASSAR